MRHRPEPNTTHRGRMFGLGLAVTLGAVAITIALMLAPTPKEGLDVPIAEASSGGRITNITLQYKDFGFGYPVEITLQRDQGKAHFAPGGDGNHGPITVGANGTFNVAADTGENKVGSKVELNVVSSSGKVLIKIHTSCSKPIAVGFLYGPDGDDTAEDPSEFDPGGPFTSGIEVAAFKLAPGDGTGQCIVATPTPTPTRTPTDTPTPVPTKTPRPTNTPLPTNTPPPTNTPRPTNTPLPTNTPPPTNTPLPTNTPPPTNTPRPTKTPVNTPTPTSTGTATSTPTDTPTPTNTPFSVVSPTVVVPTPTPTESPNMSGDVNCDRKVGSRDALMILQLNAGLKNILPCIKNADVNCDGAINSLDAQIILQFVAGFLDSLPHCSEKRLPQAADVAQGGLGHLDLGASIGSLW